MVMFTYINAITTYLNINIYMNKYIVMLPSVIMSYDYKFNVIA